MLNVDQFEFKKNSIVFLGWTITHDVDVEYSELYGIESTELTWDVFKLFETMDKQVGFKSLEEAIQAIRLYELAKGNANE